MQLRVEFMFVGAGFEILRSRKRTAMPAATLAFTGSPVPVWAMSSGVIAKNKSAVGM